MGAEPRCEYCDGTGDVHSIDGEWRGRCTCPAGRAVLVGVDYSSGPDWTVEGEYRVSDDGKVEVIALRSWKTTIDAEPTPQGALMTPSQIKLLADLRSGAVRLVPVEMTAEMATAYRLARMNIEGGYGGPGPWEAALAAASAPDASLAEMIEGLVEQAGSWRRVAERCKEEANTSESRVSALQAEVERLKNGRAPNPRDVTHREGCDHTHSPVWLCDCPRALSQETQP